MKQIRCFIDEDLYNKVVSFGILNYIKSKNGRVEFNSSLRAYLKGAKQ